MTRIRPRHAASLVELLRPFNRPEMRGVEVGVLAGATSQALLRSLPHLFLWMVDSWSQAIPGSSYFESEDGAGRLSQSEHLANLHCAFERTSFASDRRVLVRSDSVIAAAAIPDESLDFVFIDAEHTYDAVRKDIAAWAPKVRPGGIVAGHDYGGLHNRRGVWGVNRAVDQYAAETGSRLQLASGRVWWLAKQTPDSPPVPTVRPIQTIRVLFGDVTRNERLGSQIQTALWDPWAREEVVHLVAGTQNSNWLRQNGAKRIDLVCEEGLLSETNKYGPWFMKTYLIDQALERFGEILYLDFDCRILRRPDEAMWRKLRAPRSARYSGSLQAQNVGYRRPVCLPIHRDKNIHPVRRCLNSSVLYCRDRGWTRDWLAAYEVARQHGIDPANLHDETFLMHAIDTRCGILDAETMVAEFEIPIACLKRNTPEAKAHKQHCEAYFYHR
ncbi:MAG: class I SAM-dependent methyltransferase [Verrucomicrobiales bacterium]|nr:class I SAM-dependent methyltransferase [Verrucomicrobiales bacterium]